MRSLSELLMDPSHRDVIIADCVRRVEAHVAQTGGLKGLSLKAGLAALKAVRADALPRATARLLPEFAAAIEPLYQQFRASGERDFSAFLKPRSAQAGAAILAVTDARVAASSHRALRSVYKKLRGTLAAELETILPGLVRGLSAHVRK